MFEQINMMPVFTISASPNVAVDGLVFAAGQAGLMKSQDGGETWAGLKIPEPVTALTFSLKEGLVVGTEDGDLLSQNASGEWVPVHE